jgi:hypothetical protein
MYGSAYRNGILLQDAIEVSGNVAVARVEVPLVGTTRMGYKTGRSTREGTMRIQAIDSSWALQVWQFTSQSLQDQINNRGKTLPSFDLTIAINDPDAYDYEEWQLAGVQCWQMPIGFAITDDIIQREIPITWEGEVPTHVYVVNSTTNPVTLQEFDASTGGPPSDLSSLGGMFAGQIAAVS